MITWDQAIAELVAQLDALDAADQKSLAFVTGGRAQPSPGADRAVPREVRRARRRSRFELFGDDVLRRANAMSFGRDAAADLRSEERALRPQLRRRLPRHLEFAGVAERRATATCGSGRPGIRGSFVQVESRMTHDRRERRRVGAGHARHRRRAGARHRARDPRAQAAARRPAAAPARSSPAGRAASTDYSPDKVEKITGRQSGSASSGWRASLPSRRPAWRSSAARRSRRPTRLFTRARRQCAERAGRRRRSAGRRVSSRRRSPMAGSESRRPGRRSTRSPPAVDGGSQSAKVLLVDGTNPVFAAPKAWKVKEALREGRRSSSASRSFVDETSVAGRPDPAGSLVPRIVGGRAARVRLADRGGQRRAAGDEAAVPDARDAGRAARRRRTS